MLEKEINFFRRVVRWGTAGEMNESNRRIIISNVIFITLPVVYLVFMLIDFETYATPLNKLRFDQFIVPIVILFCIAALFLNKFGQTIASRSMFLLIWPLLLHIVPISLQHSPMDYMVAFPFGIVFHAVLIQLMVSSRSEPYMFAILAGFNLLMLISFPSMLTYFDTKERLPIELVGDKYYFFVGILYWLLFNLVTFYIIREIGAYINRIDEATELIEQQKEELNRTNENLSEVVEQRTSTLLEQNEKLRKLAFFNAHLLRAPLCHVQGLLQLQDMDNISESDRKEIREKLAISLSALDARIHELQEIVDSNQIDFE